MKKRCKTNPRGFTLRTLKPITLATALALSLLGGAARAQTYTVLHHFAGFPSDGENPYAGLVLDGTTLYGTTSWTVFKLNTNGADYTVLHSLSSAYGDLVLSGNTLYGTTSRGGTNDAGTVFKLNTDGTGYTVLKDFRSVAGDSPDGREPMAGLVLSGNTLYGTAAHGGTWGYGTVFKLDTNGTGFTVLKRFTGSDGANPFAALVLSGSTLYGTTYMGGWGTVFKLNTDGTGFTVLKYLNDGMWPRGELLLSGSTLYGTTYQGGSAGYGTVFKLNTDGTGYTVLWNFLGEGFDSCPTAGLVLSGSTLYGSAAGSGGVGWLGPGALFKVDTNGTNFAVLNRFAQVDPWEMSGVRPYGRLVLSGSTLYGTTYSGGNSNLGTVFKLELAPQLGPISLSNGVPHIPVTGPGEVTLQIQVSTASLSAWDVLTNLTLDYGMGLFSDPDATNYPMRFYRAMMQ